MTDHISAPRWASMLREFTLSLSLSAGVATLTDWRDVRLELPGATLMIVANLTLTIIAAIATGLLQFRWPGPQGLAPLVRGALILLGPITVAALYMFGYPLFL